MARNGEYCPKKAKRNRKRVDVQKVRQEAAYLAIDQLKDRYAITSLCQILEISRASYYKWKNREVPAEELRNRQLMEIIQEVYDQHNGIYGYRRMTIYLNHYLGCAVNHKRVYRLMKILGLKAVIRQKRKRYIPHTPQHTAENRLNREFQSDVPFEKLLTDVTEFKLTNGQKVYLSAILDLGGEKIIAHKLSQSNNNALVNETVIPILDKVIPEQTILHSDRGYQYTSPAFRQLLKRHEVIQSMSRVGKCIDNGPIENFWGILKTEMYYLNKYDTFEQLSQDIDRYIHFFNTKRITLKMGLAIPV